MHEALYAKISISLYMNARNFLYLYDVQTVPFVNADNNITCQLTTS